MDRREAEKREAALRSLEFVKDGMLLGLGSGSTVRYALEGLGARVRGGLEVRGIPTSEGTRQIAESVGIPLVDFEPGRPIDLVIDGADEVDPDFQMIKGGGGALLREKIVASAARRVVIIVDSTKTVERLGSFPLPLEVVPFGRVPVGDRLHAMGIEWSIRRRGDEPFFTDNGNLVFDCRTGPIDDPADLDRRLRSIPGVVETGLFVDLLDVLVTAGSDGVDVREAKRS